MSQFLDHAFIEARSGDGGNGIVAWRREKYEPMGGPAGGSGGRGGHVFVESSDDLSTLIDFRFKSKFAAAHGGRGRPKGMHGRAAPDLIIKVPVGTVIKDRESGEVIADLVAAKQRVMVAEGGAGGRGNALLSTPTRRAPHFCEPGQRGVLRQLELELKILADVGIIGLPNAGKSTLLSVITAAKPKIADYPFSTLEPNLGVVQSPYGTKAFVVADIPGLVEGASQGVGLGHDFLRHIERTRLIIHLVDISAETLEKDVETVDRELRLYNEELEELPHMLVLNKADIIAPEQVESIKTSLQSSPLAETHSQPLVISAATGEGMDALLRTLSHTLDALEPPAAQSIPDVIPADQKAHDHSDEGFEIVRKKKVFTIFGDRVERLVAVTNMRDPESLYHLHHVLKVMGVIEALLEAGAGPGSEVRVAGSSFVFGEDWL